MSRRTVYIPYDPRTILNRAKRPDHWFWARYSAHPYLGCQHGCAFCYCREQKFSPHNDPEDFDHIIKVKANAPNLLLRALSRLPVDLIQTGDYQPVERKFGLSRRMLEICLQQGFPVLILERSPLVLRDLDLLSAIQDRSQAVVIFSIIYTQDSPRAAALRSLERLAPLPEKRLAAMEKIAAAGIMTGASLMPLLPGLCDTPENLESVIRSVSSHGGKFVLASSLTLAGRQKEFFLSRFGPLFPELLPTYHFLYPPASYEPAGIRWHETARKIRALCSRYGILDRMPRPVIPGEKRQLNKRIVETLANHSYTLEITDAPSHEVWAFRKAAWAVEDLQQDLRLVYSSMGLKGLENISGIGLEMAKTIETFIKASGSISAQNYSAPGENMLPIPG